jgi:hypothetical protein
VNPNSCAFKAALSQTGQIVGGTGQFAAASGSSTATVNALGVLARNPDGSCAFDKATPHEVDTVESSGTLSF